MNRKLRELAARIHEIIALIRFIHLPQFIMESVNLSICIINSVSVQHLYAVIIYTERSNIQFKMR